jgi:hypothetical protein
MTRHALAALALLALAAVALRLVNRPDTGTVVLVWDATSDDIDWLAEYQPDPAYAGRN